MQTSLIPGDPRLLFMHFPFHSERVKLASQQLTPSKLGERKKAHLVFLFPVSFFQRKGLKNFPDLLQSYLHNTVFMRHSIKAQRMSYGPPSLPEGRGFIFSYWGKSWIRSIKTKQPGIWRELSQMVNKRHVSKSRNPVGEGTGSLQSSWGASLLHLVVDHKMALCPLWCWQSGSWLGVGKRAGTGRLTLLCEMQQYFSPPFWQAARLIKKIFFKPTVWIEKGF